VTPASFRGAFPGHPPWVQDWRPSVSDWASVETTAEQERLALAASDMRQAAAAATLLDMQIDVHARRALETAISVCYARPWLDSNKSGKLKDKWRPAVGPDRDLHDRLLELRRNTYAHTDPDGGRKAVVSITEPEGFVGIGEEWRPLPRSDLEAIADLCERQAARFSSAVASSMR
jgi:hypothetical protein